MWQGRCFVFGNKLTTLRSGASGRSVVVEQAVAMLWLSKRSQCCGRATNTTDCTFQFRLKKSNEMQQYADIYLLLNYCTCFGHPSRHSSGVHKTVFTASRTDHAIWGASFFKHDQIRTSLVTFEEAASGTGHTIWGASFFKRGQIKTYLVTFEEACSPDSMICTRGCNYSFMYS